MTKEQAAGFKKERVEIEQWEETVKISVLTYTQHT